MVDIYHLGSGFVSEGMTSGYVGVEVTLSYASSN